MQTAFFQCLSIERLKSSEDGRVNFVQKSQIALMAVHSATYI